MLGMFAVEMVVRVLNNPTALSAHSETLGSYSYSETFAQRAELGLALMPAEELMLRRLVFGSNSASVTVRSTGRRLRRSSVWPGLPLALESAPPVPTLCKMSQLAVLVPVLGRPARVKPFLDAFLAATPDCEIFLIADP